MYYTPSVIGTGGSTIEANANVTLSSGNYTGNPADLRAGFLHGSSFGVSIGGGIGFRISGSVMHAPASGSNNGFNFLGFEVGIGLETGATGIGIQGLYKQTIAVVPLIKF